MSRKTTRKKNSGSKGLRYGGSWRNWAANGSFAIIVNTSNHTGTLTLSVTSEEDTIKESQICSFGKNWSVVWRRKDLEAGTPNAFSWKGRAWKGVARERERERQKGYPEEGLSSWRSRRPHEIFWRESSRQKEITPGASADARLPPTCCKRRKYWKHVAK